MNWQVILHGTGPCRGLYQINIRILAIRTWSTSNSTLFDNHPSIFVIIISWRPVYIWINTKMEFKYSEFNKNYYIPSSLSLSLSLSLSSLPNYLVKMFYNVERQYMQHTLARIVADDNICRVKISFWRQCMSWGDNMCREYRHKLSPATIHLGTKICVAT